MINFKPACLRLKPKFKFSTRNGANQKNSVRNASSESPKDSSSVLAQLISGSGIAKIARDYFHNH